MSLPNLPEETAGQKVVHKHRSYSKGSGWFTARRAETRARNDHVGRKRIARAVASMQPRYIHAYRRCIPHYYVQ
eukprot:6207837-Pleurochrysis_carterae.AAC.2